MPESFGQDRRMKRVSKTSFFLETWDIVKAPGFLKARPVYESAVSEDKKEVSESVQSSEQIHEEPTQSSNEELAQLKSQLDQLTKIVEKVVDDVYEEPTNEEEQVVEEVKEVKEEPKLTLESIAQVACLPESLAQVASLLADSTISESSLVGILELLIKKEAK